MVKRSPTSAPDEPSAELIAALAEAREAGKPWFELARIMEPALGDSPEQSAAAAVLGRAAGIAPAVAKRYARLLARMREISLEMGLAEDRLLVPSFNSQEIAARIYRRDKLEGGDVLRRLAKGEITLPRLREIQSRDLASPNVSLRSAIAHRRTANASVVELALRNESARLFGEGCRTRRRPKLRFMGNTGHEVIGADGAILAGVDALFPDVRLGHDALERNLDRSLLLGQFFPKFYVAFPASAEPGDGRTTEVERPSRSLSERDMVERTVDLLEWLRYDWIGVLVAIDERTLEVVRPSEGKPVPDMTGRYEAFVRKYASAPVDNPFRRKE